MKVDGEGLEDPGRKTGPSPLQEKNQQELEMAVKQGETRERTASFPNSGHFGETLWTPSTKMHLENAGLVESFPDWLSPTPTAERRNLDHHVAREHLVAEHHGTLAQKIAASCNQTSSSCKAGAHYFSGTSRDQNRDS